MNTELLHSLMACETDVNGAMQRFSGNETLYVSCLRAFLADPTMGELTEDLRGGAWDDAFTAAHALKGLAGNMGFVPLFHAVGELVVLLRDGRLGELPATEARMQQCYNEVVAAICHFEKL